MEPSGFVNVTVEEGCLFGLIICETVEAHGAVCAEINQGGSRYFCLKGVKTMKIKFSWDSGWMEVEVDFVIEHMKLSNYRKWAKLFAQYGTAEQHKEFLERLDIYMGCEDRPAKLKRYERMQEVLKGLVS